MNILMFDAAFPLPVVGGKEKQAYLLAKELVSSGISVEAFSYFHNKNKSENFNGIRIRRVTNNPVLCLPVIFLYLFFKRFKFSILHVHTPSRIGLYVSFLGLLFGYKLVFKFPGQNIIQNTSGVSLYVLNLILKYSKLLVVLEADTYDKLISMKIEKEKIFFTANGVLISKLKETSKNKPFIIIFIGRLVPIKRCEDLISACSLLGSNQFDWELHFVGDGPLLKRCKDFATKLHINNSVIFLGYQDDIQKALQKADILALTSESEGMSNVILEAMSVGLPIIATNVGAVEKQLGTLGSKYLCEVGNINEISCKIKFLLLDFELRQKYGRYLHKRCIEKFSIKSITKQYIRRYEAL